jgi:transcriptional regulator with XRE-family HTH domain
MTLKQTFIHNLRKYRTREGLSQMQLAEYCGISTVYFSEIETGKKFPSIGVIEKLAAILRIEPYLLFKSQSKTDLAKPSEETHLPYYVNKQLQKELKTYIKKQVNQSTSQILAEITDIINKY